MVEFIVSDDGTRYLMEINTLFWGSLQLAVDAGVDFLSLLYQLACGQQPEPVKTYRTGRRLRWLLGDLEKLYHDVDRPRSLFPWRQVARPAEIRHSIPIQDPP
jgi:predicted ATP-grasp superfamily ATP-dependent carboligase